MTTLKQVKTIKSVWSSDKIERSSSGKKHIIHHLYIKFTNKPEKVKFRTVLGKGYLKCGSDFNAYDWPNKYSLFQFVKQKWVIIKTVLLAVKPSENNKIQWLEIPPSVCYMIVIKSSAVDGSFPCYNLANSSFQFIGRGENIGYRAGLRSLHKINVTLPKSNLISDKITFIKTSTFIKYSTPFYSIGFKIKTAGLSFLAFDGSGSGKTTTNLLSLGSIFTEPSNDYLTQGPVFKSIENEDDTCFSTYALIGETIILNNRVTYYLVHRKTNNKLQITFTINLTNFKIELVQTIITPYKLLESTPWRIAFNAKELPITLLGIIDEQGETGSVILPATMPLAGIANIKITGTDNMRARFNAIRPAAINTLDFEFADTANTDGCRDYKIGTSIGTMQFEVGLQHHLKFNSDANLDVKKAFARYIYSSLPFRADTSVLSNNGCSIGSPICLDVWAHLCTSIKDGPCGISPSYFLRKTIEAFLNGAPGYASGKHSSQQHLLEDEYLFTGAASLLGIAKYLENYGDLNWYNEYRKIIHLKIRQLKTRDIDNDGLIESKFRKGKSGEHQWSTCWYDIISYGYKDAFSNAILYEALNSIIVQLVRFDDVELSQEIMHWKNNIKLNYSKTFQTRNNWFAGWQSEDGILHDYAFLAVNGAAVACGLVSKAEGFVIMSSLWHKLLATGYDSFDLGLPGNIDPIPMSDMADWEQFRTFGNYQNGGITISQSRHFINGLIHVGMSQEADLIMMNICRGLIHSNLIGGVGSGLDWKSWDGVSSGYEGFLCDQLGVFQPLIKRYCV